MERGIYYLIPHVLVGYRVREHNFIEFEQELTENVGFCNVEVDVFPTVWMFLITSDVGYTP